MSWDEVLNVVVGVASVEGGGHRTVLIGAYPDRDEAIACLRVLPMASQEVVFDDRDHTSLLAFEPRLTTRSQQRTVNWRYALTTTPFAPPRHESLAWGGLGQHLVPESPPKDGSACPWDLVWARAQRYFTKAVDQDLVGTKIDHLTRLQVQDVAERALSRACSDFQSHVARRVRHIEVDGFGIKIEAVIGDRVYGMHARWR